MRSAADQSATCPPRTSLRPQRARSFRARTTRASRIQARSVVLVGDRLLPLQLQLDRRRRPGREDLQRAVLPPGVPVLVDQPLYDEKIYKNYSCRPTGRSRCSRRTRSRPGSRPRTRIPTTRARRSRSSVPRLAGRSEGRDQLHRCGEVRCSGRHEARVHDPVCDGHGGCEAADGGRAGRLATGGNQDQPDHGELRHGVRDCDPLLGQVTPGSSRTGAAAGSTHPTTTPAARSSSRPEQARTAVPTRTGRTTP